MKTIIKHKDWCRYIDEMYKLHLELGERKKEYYYTLATCDYMALVNSDWFNQYASQELGTDKNEYCGHKIWVTDAVPAGTIRITKSILIPKRYKVTFYIDSTNLSNIKRLIDDVRGSEHVDIYADEEIEAVVE